MINAVIAVNPQQMAEAQSTTIDWISAKLAAAEHELEEADRLHEQLVGRAMRTDTAKRMMDRAAKRVRFYEKVKAALAAGYYIIPPFPLQLFAVRTDRKGPTANRSESARGPWANEVKARSLPIGEGRYINPLPVRELVDEERRPVAGDQTGKTQLIPIYANTEFRDELDLPVRALKPQLIEAVGKALEQKIFDALGIAPAYRDPDPIIAGQIARPDGQGHLTFFVAWWLDERDL